RVHVGRALRRGALARKERDRPAAPPAVHRDGVGPLADEVLVREPRQVDTAGSREAVPLPEPRVDLHQAVGAVARVALELDLREALVPELAQEPQALVDYLLDPNGLPDPARADPGRRLPQLAPAEEAERFAVGRE